MSRSRPKRLVNSLAGLYARRTERQEQKQTGPVLDAAGEEVEVAQQDLLRAPCGATSTVLPAGAGMRRVATAAVIGLLLTNCTTPPAEYHDVVQHPYVLRETTATLDLTGRSAAEFATAVSQFAADRPNSGSRFVITADTDGARQIRAALRSAGIRSVDIQLVPAAEATKVVRHDVAATVPDCVGAPRAMLGFGSIDDGFGHNNANSALLGCAVRRNIAAMVDDPRTLAAAEPASARDGARATEIYGHWIKGEPTESKETLPSARTADSGVQDGGK